MLIPEVFGRPGKVAELISNGAVATESIFKNTLLAHFYGRLFLEEAIVSPRWLHRFTSIYRYTTRAYHHASTCSGTSTKIMVVFYIQLLSAGFFFFSCLSQRCLYFTPYCIHMQIPLHHVGTCCSGYQNSPDTEENSLYLPVLRLPSPAKMSS